VPVAWLHFKVTLPTLLTLSSLSHGFHLIMLRLRNSAQGVWTPHVGFWPHATGTKHAHKIETTCCRVS